MTLWGLIATTSHAHLDHPGSATTSYRQQPHLHTATRASGEDAVARAERMSTSAPCASSFNLMGGPGPAAGLRAVTSCPPNRVLMTDSLRHPNMSGNSCSKLFNPFHIRDGCGSSPSLLVNIPMCLLSPLSLYTRTCFAQDGSSSSCPCSSTGRPSFRAS